MTHATQRRLARLYQAVVGYDPTDCWTMPEALEGLRWMRTALQICSCDPTAYTGDSLTSAALRAMRTA